MDLLTQLTANVTPGAEYVSDSPDIASPPNPLVRLIAFYLPQFHPIPENDAAWGKGFTEWANVSKAIPRFVGHYQPRLPGELGFYDLRLADVLRRQTSLARRYGIYGFCFHYYWFEGRRLLETPLRLLLESPDIDLPFCISWANHDWERNWGGGGGELIIEQRYSADDDHAFAAALEPLMSDKRYIRINGRPLLLVYKPGLLPHPLKTVERWRSRLLLSGLGDPYIVKAHIDDFVDPSAFAMDAGVDFPPAPKGWLLPDIGAAIAKFDNKFSGIVRSYEMMAALYCAQPRRDHVFFHGVSPGWDNEPRQPGRGATFIGSSPRTYGSWLKRACRRTLGERVGDERLVFVNAWNEWGEGAYLEPDRHFGYAFLAATRRVITSLSESNGAINHRAVASRVYTSFGSVLFVDKFGKVRHGPICTSPANLFLVSRLGAAKFVRRLGGQTNPVSFESEVGRVGPPSGSERGFELIAVNSEQLLTGLKAGDKYLSAEPSGEVLLNRSHCKDWEYFRVLPDLNDD